MILLLMRSKGFSNKFSNWPNIFGDIFAKNTNPSFVTKNKIMKKRGFFRFTLAQSTKKFNLSIVAFVGAIIILILIKKFSTSARQTFGDLHLRNKEEITQAFIQAESNLSEAELADLNNLIMRGMRMLPDYEREKLEKLQKKYAYKGHKHFSEDDVITMRQLNYKGINYLSEEDQSRFHYLMLKATGRISSD